MLYSHVEAVLTSHCPSTSPVLLALSGGADSLCLFYCLLAYRQGHGVPFHVAHVDHGWRDESRNEAQALKELADKHQVPFHLKRLEPSSLAGNLEAACREERYAFFSELCILHQFQGVLTGHHQNDQAETIFKRILEGAHWSRWTGLQVESRMHGMRLLRPLLEISKKEIQQTLEGVAKLQFEAKSALLHLGRPHRKLPIPQSDMSICDEGVPSAKSSNLTFKASFATPSIALDGFIPFEDPSNKDVKYLRARFRESLFPRLNQEFGKDVQGSLLDIGEDAKELTRYFDELMTPHLNELMRGPWGVCLDLQASLPRSQLEIKFLLRLLCRTEGFFISKTIVEKASKALINGSANLKFEMGNHQIAIDRKRIFILANRREPENPPGISLAPGSLDWGTWQLDVAEDIYTAACPLTSWKEAWLGQLRCCLPKRNYQLIGEVDAHRSVLTRRWSQAKIPFFLTRYFPLLRDGLEICHEFLTGKSSAKMREGDPCWKIILTYADEEHRVRSDTSN